MGAAVPWKIFELSLVNEVSMMRTLPLAAFWVWRGVLSSAPVRSSATPVAWSSEDASSRVKMSSVLRSWLWAVASSIESTGLPTFNARNPKREVKASIMSPRISL